MHQIEEKSEQRSPHWDSKLEIPPPGSGPLHLPRADPHLGAGDAGINSMPCRQPLSPMPCTSSLRFGELLARPQPAPWLQCGATVGDPACLANSVAEFDFWS
ncbi:hypothetical protein XENOCAPTIV_020371 [Xenoophorus captivus]|uniref:Uncharacterized protein n=1 Tax=Xenoophorus captivus TaxID=1517983 RepID=A0ABV0R9R5_9TELE